MKPEYPQKTTNLPQVTDKLYHIILLTNTYHSLVELSRMFLHFGRNYDRFDRDRMVVIFTTVYVIGAIYWYLPYDKTIQ
jgi:DNA-binding MurR/RpiR family transcriptional regulator